MIEQGRIPLSKEEHVAIEKLLRENDGAAISLTRRDPGETGPVLVHVADVTYQIDENGHRRKVN
jgi:hypothetical protein